MSDAPKSTRSRERRGPDRRSRETRGPDRRVSDEGPGFNPVEIPDPTCPDHLEECGGRGLFLMRRLSNGCRFTHGGRTVEMRFKLD